MKIGIFTDIHANLPALKKALDFFNKENCDRIIHTGDLIAIGPYPKECMDLALRQKNLEFIMGNHDYWYAYGVPNPLPKLMNQEEADHQAWTRKTIGPAYYDTVKTWPFSMDIKLNDSVTLNFRHYGLNEKQTWFGTYYKNPSKQDLDQLFHDVNATMIFYGHDHHPIDLQGRCRYINLGSAGCYDRAEVRLGILEQTGDETNFKSYSIPYEDNGLMEAFEERAVPARDFITKAFLTRK